jgi:hypothetical protein
MNETVDKCLTPECRAQANRDTAYKGLCMKCYSSAKKLVESGKTTWGHLAEMGLAKQEETAFERAFREKQSKMV